MEIGMKSDLIRAAGWSILFLALLLGPALIITW